MTKKQELFKLTLAACLTALSIVLDIIFKAWIPTNGFGFPYFAIPLIIGSIILGPIYGGIMGFLSDVIGFYLGGSTFSFNPMFSLTAIAWGMLPYFLTFKKKHWAILLAAILVTHITATSLNTWAMYLLPDSRDYALRMFPIRMVWLPLNVLIITILSYGVLKALNQVISPINQKDDNKTLDKVEH